MPFGITPTTCSLFVLEVVSLLNNHALSVWLSGNETTTITNSEQVVGKLIVSNNNYVIVVVQNQFV